MSHVAWVLVALIALAAGGASSDRALPDTTPTPVLGVHAPVDDPSLRGRTYVVLGDSISVGSYATTSERTFPARVADQLGMEMVLVARSGAKAAWALPELAGVQAAQPALVTIELGTNDVGFSTPVEDFALAYDAILDAVAQPGTRVVCVGSWLPSATFDALIADGCRRHGGAFVSLNGFYEVNAFHAVDGGSTFRGRSDWFHPGDEGHAAIAAAVLAGLNGRTDGANPSPLAANAAGLLLTPR